MNIDEAKAVLVPLCPTKPDGRPLSPGFCDEDLIAIAEEINELHRLLPHAFGAGWEAHKAGKTLEAGLNEILERGLANEQH